MLFCLSPTSYSCLFFQSKEEKNGIASISGNNEFWIQANIFNKIKIILKIVKNIFRFYIKLKILYFLIGNI